MTRMTRMTRLGRTVRFVAWATSLVGCCLALWGLVVLIVWTILALTGTW